MEGKAYCIFAYNWNLIDIFLTNRRLVESKRGTRHGTGQLSWHRQLLGTACSRSCFHQRWRQRLDLVRTSDTAHLQWNLTRIQRRRQLLRGGTYSTNSTAGGGTQGQDRETERKQNNNKLEYHNKVTVKCKFTHLRDFFRDFLRLHGPGNLHVKWTRKGHSCENRLARVSASTETAQASTAYISHNFQAYIY